MNFSYKITPKNRGNWRPEISFSFSLSAGDIAHRPYFSDLVLVSGSLAVPYKPGAISFPRDTIVIALADSKEDDKGETWAMYRDDRRGDTETFKLYDRIIAGDRGSFLKIVDHGYANNPLSFDFSFFGPWKPGKKPDYSEIVPILFEIRDSISIMQTNGLEDGPNEEISGSMFSVRNGDEWIGTGVNPEVAKDRVINSDVRQIDLG